MKQIRRGVFETNSSNMHALTVCSKEEFDAWENGDILFHKWNERFIDKNLINVFSEDEIIAYYNKKKEMFWKDWEQLTDDEKMKFTSEFEEVFDQSYDYKTLRQYIDDCYPLNYYSESYKTKSGDEIVIFGYYGYDG